MTADKDTIEKIIETQKTALEITKKHLADPIREIENQKYETPEVACALIMLAYHILRQSKSEKVAGDTFDVLAHFAKERLEKGRKNILKKLLN